MRNKQLRKNNSKLSKRLISKKVKSPFQKHKINWNNNNCRLHGHMREKICTKYISKLHIYFKLLFLVVVIILFVWYYPYHKYTTQLSASLLKGASCYIAGDGPNTPNNQNSINPKLYETMNQPEVINDANHIIITAVSTPVKVNEMLKLKSEGSDCTIADNDEGNHYWYSIMDISILLMYLRKEILEYRSDVVNFANEVASPVRENNQMVFIADPYHDENFENYLNDDINIILGICEQQERNRFFWYRMPKILIIPVLSGLHWRSIIIVINYETNTVNIMWDDPYGNFPFQLRINLLSPILSNILKLIKKNNWLRPECNTVDETELINFNYNEYQNENDQQGRGSNGWDSGPITVINISDYLHHYLMKGNITNVVYYLEQYDKYYQIYHENLMLSIRANHLQQYCIINKNNSVKTRTRIADNSVIDKLNESMESISLNDSSSNSDMMANSNNNNTIIELSDNNNVDIAATVIELSSNNKVDLEYISNYVSNDKWFFGTLNVRTLALNQKNPIAGDAIISALPDYCSYFKKLNLHVIALQETRISLQQYEQSGDYIIHFSGGCGKRHNGVGIGVIMKWKCYIREVRAVNDRLMWLVIQNTDLDLDFVVFSAYCPTNVAMEEVRSEFWNNLILEHREVKKCYPNSKILYGGDFNARVGATTPEDVSYSEVLDPLLPDNDRNENVDELLLFCQHEKLIITNSFLSNPENAVGTWRLPSNDIEKQLINPFTIDHVLLNKEG